MPSGRSLKRRTSWAVSASQVEAFTLCERKWAFRTEEKYKRNIGAFRGDSTWQIIQKYGKFGTPPANHHDTLVRILEKRYTTDLDEKGIDADAYATRIIGLAEKMIELYPQTPWPKKHKVEERFKIKIKGVPWAGAIDMHGPGYVRDNKVVAAAEFALLKERDPAKPAHEKREVLRENVQALLYAYKKLLAEPADAVKLDWVYGLPGSKPRAWHVLDEVSREYVNDRITEINETGRKIVRLALVHPDPLSLKPNWDACSAYGGCPFQDKCQPTVEDIASTVFPEERTEDSMGLFKDIKKSKGRKIEEEDEDLEVEEDEDEEVEAPKGKPKKGERGAGKVDKAAMLESAKEDVEQLVDMKVKSKQIVESIIAKYKFLTEDEIEELISEFAPKKGKKTRVVETEDDEEGAKPRKTRVTVEDEDEDDEEETPKAKKSLGAKQSKVSDEMIAIRAMVAKALRDAADALDD